MNQTKLILILCLGFLMFKLSFAQLDNQSTYKFLTLTQSSRTTALGGALVSVIDNDVALGYANPALTNELMHGRFSLNHNFHFADIQHGFVNYGFHLDKINTSFHAGINYISYGTFQGTDQFGNQITEFDAGELALTIGAGRQLNERIRAGVNLKFVNSNLDAYGSFGIVGDYGLYYENPESLLGVGLVLKNAGIQLSKFAETRESTPIDLQLGFSKKFAHLPFRFSVIGHQLLDWSLRFDSEFSNNVSILGDTNSETSTLNRGIDNFFRHFIFNGEFLIGSNENFKLRIGYNHLRKRELSLSQFRSLGGLSFGFGLKIKKISFDYGVGYYHLAGAVNHLGISVHLREFRKKI